MAVSLAACVGSPTPEVVPEPTLGATAQLEVTTAATEPAPPTATSTPAQDGTSFSKAAPVGVTIASIIECGEGYESHELYDVKITLLETARGDKAWEMISEADASVEPPEADFDYVLAHVRFEYSARGLPGTCVLELIGSEQFVAVSASAQRYEVLPVRLEPQLNAQLHSGDAAEGWVAFIVSQDDSTPLMYFTADPSAVVAHGGEVWFRLY